MDFATKFRRCAAKINKSEASEAVGLHKTTISSYLAKGSIPRADIALKIAKALEVPLDWLMDDAQDFPPPDVSAGTLKTEELVAELGHRMMSLATAALLKIIQAENTPWLEIGDATLVADPDKLPKRVSDAVELHQQISALVRELDRFDPRGQVGSDIPPELAKWVQPDFELSLGDVLRRAANLHKHDGYDSTMKLGSMLIGPAHWRPPWFEEQLKAIRGEIAADLQRAHAAKHEREAKRAAELATRKPPRRRTKMA